MENIIDYIRNSPKKTPVSVYIWEKEPVEFSGCQVFQGVGCKLVFGQWEVIGPILDENQDKIDSVITQCDRRQSAVPLLNIESLNARIEPGAIIRERVTVGAHAVVMMGAILNIGAVVGEGSMIDMGAILGGRAQVGKNCHIGAGAVLAGVIEPESATPVVIEDGVLVGANAVILEGVRVGAEAVVAAGAVVTRDVPPRAVVAGCPARLIKWKDKKTADKTGLTDGLR